jgi:hypothetical protein
MQKKFLICRADNFQPLGAYTGQAINLGAYQIDASVIHAEMSDGADPSKPYLLRRSTGWYAVSYFEYVMADAVEFGQRLLLRFGGENVALGITQRGMTTTVRLYMANVINCLITGSLYDAMAQVRAVPPEHKDDTFITDARLLVFVNSIEDYLGMSRSVSL